MVGAFGVGLCARDDAGCGVGHHHGRARNGGPGGIGDGPHDGGAVLLRDHSSCEDQRDDCACGAREAHGARVLLGRAGVKGRSYERLAISTASGPGWMETALEWGRLAVRTRSSFVVRPVSVAGSRTTKSDHPRHGQQRRRSAPGQASPTGENQDTIGFPSSVRLFRSRLRRLVISTGHFARADACRPRISQVTELSRLTSHFAGALAADHVLENISTKSPPNVSIDRTLPSC